MARSSTSDPIEKFRFKVTVISISPTLAGGVESLAAIGGLGGEAEKFAKQTRVLLRAGFSEITLPRP